MNFKVNDFVEISGLPDYDNQGRITCINYEEKRAHVSSMNMPFCGGICQWFNFSKLKKKFEGEA